MELPYPLLLRYCLSVNVFCPVCFVSFAIVSALSGVHEVVPPLLHLLMLLLQVTLEVLAAPSAISSFAHPAFCDS